MPGSLTTLKEVAVGCRLKVAATNDSAKKTTPKIASFRPSADPRKMRPKKSSEYVVVVAPDVVGDLLSLLSDEA